MGNRTTGSFIRWVLPDEESRAVRLLLRVPLSRFFTRALLAVRVMGDQTADRMMGGSRPDIPGGSHTFFV